MRIVAIDASRRKGVVSASVEQAARAAEAAGADVQRLRLTDLEIRTCTGCGICRGNGVCKISDDLPAVAAAVERADGVIVGTPGLKGRDAAPTQALVERLAGYFGSDEAKAAAGPDKVRRAIIITACKSPEPIATFFSQATGPIRALRQALGLGGFKTIGSVAVAKDWFGGLRIGRTERDSAACLGRVLAGKI
ncbi:MAG: flavodoxin family protein [Coriobacteriales bacterium]|nr:flavodoxin family protein [Coriobacteriales bacterium]